MHKTSSDARKITASENQLCMIREVSERKSYQAEPTTCVGSIWALHRHTCRLFCNPALSLHVLKLHQQTMTALDKAFYQ
jgi:hypothetical protein